jgi:protein TonB
MNAGRKHPRASRCLAGAALVVCLTCGAAAAAPGNAPKGSFGELKVTDGDRARAAPEMPAELASPSLADLKSGQPATDPASRPDLGVAIELPSFTPDFAPPPPADLDAANIAEPRLVNRVEPEYPRDALLNGTSGWVRVAFDVRQNGRVDEVSVIEADPPRVFNRAAIRAVKRWRFQPSSGAGPGVRRLERVIEFNAGGR